MNKHLVSFFCLGKHLWKEFSIGFKIYFDIVPGVVLAGCIQVPTYQHLINLLHFSNCLIYLVLLLCNFWFFFLAKSDVSTTVAFFMSDFVAYLDKSNSTSIFVCYWYVILENKSFYIIISYLLIQQLKE